MKKNVLILLVALVVISGISCDKDKELRETLALRVYEVGFREGVIFAFDFAINVLTGSISADEIDLEDKVFESWEASGIPTSLTVCDSLGVVMDTLLGNALLNIYSMAFAAGIGEGERYITEDMAADTSGYERDEEAVARVAFEEDRSELLYFLEDIEFKHIGQK